MKKFLTLVLSGLLSMPALMAYDVKYRDLCYDIVGFDSENNLTCVELVRGDIEINENTRLSVESEFYVNGNNYFVTGIAKDAFAGITCSGFSYSDRSRGRKTTFTFGDNCFKDATFKKSLCPTTYFMNANDTHVIYGENCFSNLQLMNTNASENISFNEVTIHKGAFEGLTIKNITFKADATLYGGAFGRVESARFMSNVKTEECDNQKVFAGINDILFDVLPYPYSSSYMTVDYIGDLADFSQSAATVTIDNINRVLPTGDSNRPFDTNGSKLVIPQFLAEKYASAPGWSNFAGNIAPVSEGYYTDNQGVVYKIDKVRRSICVIDGSNAKGDIVLTGIFDGIGENCNPYYIYPYAFEGNSEITSLSIPMTEYVGAFNAIGTRAFADCYQLYDVKIYGATACEGAFVGCPVENLEIDFSLSAYYYNNDRPATVFDNTIRKLSIKRSTTGSLGGLYNALSARAEIYTESITPAPMPEQSQVVYNTATVSVPYGMVDTYKATQGWDKFTKISARDYDGKAFIVSPFLIEVLDLEARTCMIKSLNLAETDNVSITVPAKVTAPDGIEFNVTKINSKTFEGAPFSSVTIEEGIEAVGSFVFSNMRNLESIELPESLTGLNDGLFNYCPALKSVKLSPKTEAIPNSAFSSCSALTDFVIPEGVKSIGDYAFGSCTQLESIAIPERVKSIGNSAFAHCIALKTMTLPSSVEMIDRGAFADCMFDKFEILDSDNELNMNYNMTIGSIKELYVGRPVNIYLPNVTSGEMTKIEDPIRCYDLRLEKIVLGEKAQSLKWLPTSQEGVVLPSATLVSQAQEPPVLLPFSDECYKEMTVEVPASAIDTYRAADVWKEFVNLSEQAGIESIVCDDNSISIIVTGKNIEITGADGLAVEIFEISGRRVAFTPCYAGETFNLAEGLYLVKAGNKVAKVKI